MVVIFLLKIIHISNSADNQKYWKWRRVHSYEM